MDRPLTDDDFDDANVRTGVPDADWTRDELTDRAKLENRHITRRENDASHYWLFGKAILPIREDLADTAWSEWCQKHKFERTRWYRAMLLARAFTSPREFADLSIDDATNLARQRLGIEPRQTPLGAKHRRRLRIITETLRKSLDDLAGASAAELAAGA